MGGYGQIWPGVCIAMISYGQIGICIAMVHYSICSFILTCSLIMFQVMQKKRKQRLDIGPHSETNLCIVLLKMPTQHSLHAASVKNQVRRSASSGVQTVGHMHISANNVVKSSTA